MGSIALNVSASKVMRAVAMTVHMAASSLADHMARQVSIGKDRSPIDRSSEVHLA